MKKHIIFFLFLVATCAATFAQERDRKKMREDIQKFKVDYIAQELKLTDKEKADFTPLYNEYDSEIRKSGEEAFRFERQLKKKKDATDDDYRKLSELQKKSRDDFNKITKKYDEKFEKILSAKQIYTMHKAEEKFFEKMKEMRKKHKDSRHKNKNRQGGVSKPKQGKQMPPSIEMAPSAIDL